VAALLLAFASSVAWGAGDFLGGLKSRRLPLLNVLVAAQLTGLVLIAAFVAIRGEGPPGGDLAFWGAFSGVAGAVGLAAFYRECTLFVAPSRYESFGLIYVEAMRWAKPVIGCRAGGIPEVVRDGETGLLVPPADPPALQAAVTRLLDDGALRDRIGTAARASVEGELSAARMAERTVDFYRAVLGRHV